MKKQSVHKIMVFLLGMICLGQCSDVLAEKKPAPKIEELIAIIQDRGGKWEVREEAIWKIQKLKNKKAVKPLIERLKDPKEVQAVKSAAIGALEAIADLRAVDPLIELLKEKKPSLRNLAAQSLSRMTKAPFFSEDYKKWKKWWKKNKKNLMK